jgi:hypothetical protein
MPVTAAKPVTKSEYEERMAIARSYGPHAVANLAAEFRRRYPVEAPAENGFGFSDLQKCGLEATADGAPVVIGGDGRLSKRLRSSRTLTSTETTGGKTTITLLSGPLEKLRIAIDADTNRHLEDLDKLEAQLTTIQAQVEKYPHLKAALDSGGAELRADHLGNLEIHVSHKHAWPHEASDGDSAEKVAKSYRPTHAQIAKDDELTCNSVGF